MYFHPDAVSHRVWRKSMQNFKRRVFYLGRGKTAAPIFSISRYSLRNSLLIQVLLEINKQISDLHQIS